MFRYHVPLFFFMAGFFSSKGLSKPAFQFLVEKQNHSDTLFLLLCSTFAVLLYEWFMESITSIKCFCELLLWDPQTPFVGSLWFINCIFVMLIIDYIASRIVRNQAFVLLLSILAMVISIYAFENNPRQTPIHILEH